MRSSCDPRSSEAGTALGAAQQGYVAGCTVPCLLDLPDEVLGCIAAHLQLHTVARVLPLVCHRLRRVCRPSEGHWRPRALTLALVSHPVPEERAPGETHLPPPTWLFPLAPSLQRLTLRLPGSSSYALRLEAARALELLQVVAGRLPRLQELTLESRVTPDGEAFEFGDSAVDALCACSGLTSLRLQGAAWFHAERSEPGLGRALRRLPGLRELHLQLLLQRSPAPQYQGCELPGWLPCTLRVLVAGALRDMGGWEGVGPALAPLRALTRLDLCWASSRTPFQLGWAFLEGDAVIRLAPRKCLPRLGGLAALRELRLDNDGYADMDWPLEEDGEGWELPWNLCAAAVYDDGGLGGPCSVLLLPPGLECVALRGFDRLARIVPLHAPLAALQLLQDAGGGRDLGFD